MPHSRRFSHLPCPPDQKRFMPPVFLPFQKLLIYGTWYIYIIICHNSEFKLVFNDKDSILQKIRTIKTIFLQKNQIIEFVFL